MKRFLILVIALAITFAGMSWLANHAGGETIAGMFINADPLVKLAAIALMLAILLALVLGLISLADRSGGAHKGLALISVWAPVLGLLVAAWHSFTVFSTVSRIGAVDSRVWGLSVAEGLIPLLIGLVAAVIAALFMLRKPQPKTVAA